MLDRLVNSRDFVHIFQKGKHFKINCRNGLRYFWRTIFLYVYLFFCLLSILVLDEWDSNVITKKVMAVSHVSKDDRQGATPPRENWTKDERKEARRRQRKEEQEVDEGDMWTSEQPTVIPSHR